MQIVEDGQVNEDLVTKVEAEVRLGAEVEEIELKVHSEDGVCVLKPSDEVLSVGWDVELEDEGWSGLEVGQLKISSGNCD